MDKVCYNSTWDFFVEVLTKEEKCYYNNFLYEYRA